LQQGRGAADAVMPFEFASGTYSGLPNSSTERPGHWTAKKKSWWKLHWQEWAANSHCRSVGFEEYRRISGGNGKDRRLKNEERSRPEDAIRR